MRVDDFVRTTDDARLANEELANVETRDAVNTGIVESANNPRKVLKEDVLASSSSSYKATPLPSLHKTTQPGETLLKLNGKYSSEGEELSKPQRIRQLSGKAIKAKAIHSTLEDSELEGMDDAYYQMKGGYQLVRSGKEKVAERKAKKKSAEDVSEGASKAKKLGKLSEKKYQKKLSPVEIQRQSQTHRNQAKAQKAAKTARETAQSARKTFLTATKSAGSAFASIGGAVTSAVVPVLGGLVALATCIMLVCVVVAGLSSQNSSLNEVENRVVSFFREKGLDDVHIAAILANMKAESGVDPTRHQDGGSAIGICQWDGGRKANLLSFAAEMGVDWTNLDLQLKFFWERDEYQNEWQGAYTITNSGSTDPPSGTFCSGSKSGFLATNDIEEAVKQFCYGWERPGIPHIGLRIQYAQDYLNALQNNSLSGNGQFTNPCPSGSVSSPFGWREGGEFHKGLDLAAPEGTPTYAADDGTVIIAGWSNSAGNWVVIDHGGGVVTKYMHHSSIMVSAGQHVTKGQQIGRVGNTGQSFGAHLHFQVEVNGQAVDPQTYL